MGKLDRYRLQGSRRLAVDRIVHEIMPPAWTLHTVAILIWSGFTHPFYSQSPTPLPRPRLSCIRWSHVIVDEGHRLKNAGCKLNAEIRQYKCDHRLLLTGTPLQNDISELWSLLNFLLPDLFNSCEDFQTW